MGLDALFPTRDHALCYLVVVVFGRLNLVGGVAQNLGDPIWDKVVIQNLMLSKLKFLFPR